MKVKIAKMGSKDRWDQLPYITFDNAAPPKALKAKGKGKSKPTRSRPVETTSQPNIAMEPRAK